MRGLLQLALPGCRVPPALGGEEANARACLVQAGHAHGRIARHIEGVRKTGDGLVLLLDLDRLCSAEAQPWRDLALERF